MVDRSRTQLLVEKAQAGDRGALERLIAHYRKRLAAGIDAIPRPRHVEPEEVLQDTFARALASIGRFRWQGEDSFYFWLCGIANNVIRKQSRTSRTIQLPERVPGTTPSPSQALQRDERFDRLEDAFAHLKEEYREVLRLAKLEGLKVKEIAARMHRSENAVRHLMARALMELKKSFGDTESLHLPDRPFPTEEDAHGKA
jgi:RNA polymerase sigma-70 factor (ECF subfamily)